MAASGSVLAPPPRWAVRAAHAVPLLVLPSALWRVVLIAGLPTGFDQPGALTLGSRASIVALSVLSELAALLTLGLVRPWGEVVPRLIPVLGDRRVPVRAVVIVACAGAAAIALICAWAVRGFVLGLGPSMFSPAGLAVLTVCYVPLLAWSPLLLAVTWSYGKRHRAAPAGPVPG